MQSSETNKLIGVGIILFGAKKARFQERAKLPETGGDIQGNLWLRIAAIKQAQESTIISKKAMH